MGAGLSPEPGLAGELWPSVLPASGGKGCGPSELRGGVELAVTLGDRVAMAGKPEEVDDAATSNSPIRTYRYSRAQSCNEDSPAKTQSAKCTLKCVGEECRCTHV